MTHKEFINEIKWKYTEAKEQLEAIDNSWLPEDEIKKKKDEIKNLFELEMEEYKNLEWYDAAVKAARHEWSMRWKVRKTKSEIKKLQWNLDELTKWHIKSKLEYWGGIEAIYNTNIESVTEYLKDFCVTPWESIESDWMIFEKITIRLPNVKWLDWKDFDFYKQTSELMDPREFRHTKYNNYSFSIDEICDILENIREFAKSVWVDIDKWIKYKNALKWNTATEASKCLMDLLNIDNKFDYRVRTAISDPAFNQNRTIRTYVNWFRFSRWWHGVHDSYDDSDYCWLLLKSLPNRPPRLKQ